MPNCLKCDQPVYVAPNGHIGKLCPGHFWAALTDLGVVQEPVVLPFEEEARTVQPADWSEPTCRQIIKQVKAVRIARNMSWADDFASDSKQIILAIKALRTVAYEYGWHMDKGFGLAEAKRWIEAHWQMYQEDSPTPK